MIIASFVFGAAGCAITVANFIILFTDKIYICKKNKAFHYICAFYERYHSAVSIEKVKKECMICNCKVEQIISELLKEGKIKSTAETDQHFLDIQVYPINYRK